MPNITSSTLTDLCVLYQETSNSEYLLNIVKHTCIKKAINSLYYSDQNYNKLTKQRIFEKDEMSSFCYIVLSERLRNFTAITEAATVSFINTSVRGYITDQTHKVYRVVEYCNSEEDMHALMDEPVDTISDIVPTPDYITKVTEEMTYFTAFYIHSKTYEEIGRLNNVSKSQAFRRVREEYEQVKQYMSSILTPEEIEIEKKQRVEHTTLNRRKNRR